MTEQKKPYRSGTPVTEAEWRAKGRLQLKVRVDAADLRKLGAICRKSDKTQGDMIAELIRQRYDAIIGKPKRRRA